LKILGEKKTKKTRKHTGIGTKKAKITSSGGGNQNNRSKSFGDKKFGDKLQTNKLKSKKLHSIGNNDRFKRLTKNNL